MSASLVGSEMCIRDSSRAWPPPSSGVSRSSIARATPMSAWSRSCASGAVSYTHLTLPTICSV
eukprot:6348554-Alexandrium_andersonii.AAC.1